MRILSFIHGGSSPLSRTSIKTAQETYLGGFLLLFPDFTEFLQHSHTYLHSIVQNFIFSVQKIKSDIGNGIGNEKLGARFAPPVFFNLSAAEGLQRILLDK